MLAHSGGGAIVAETVLVAESEGAWFRYGRGTRLWDFGLKSVRTRLLYPVTMLLDFRPSMVRRFEYEMMIQDHD